MTNSVHKRNLLYWIWADKGLVYIVHTFKNM
jgi:hypothetical protein